MADKNLHLTLAVGLNFRFSGNFSDRIFVSASVDWQMSAVCHVNYLAVSLHVHNVICTLSFHCNLQLNKVTPAYIRLRKSVADIVNNNH